MMTDYCTPCIYCRPISYAAGDVCCHYYLDTGNARGCKGGDGCTARVILPPEERKAYIAKLSELNRQVARIPQDPRLEDYIVDKRGSWM